MTRPLHIKYIHTGVYSNSISSWILDFNQTAKFYRPSKITRCTLCYTGLCMHEPSKFYAVMFSYLSFLRVLILFQTTIAHAIMHPVAVATTRTTITTARDPPFSICSAEFGGEIYLQ